jgi:hypothetical protein
MKKSKGYGLSDWEKFDHGLNVRKPRSRAAALIEAAKAGDRSQELGFG